MKHLAHTGHFLVKPLILALGMAALPGTALAADSVASAITSGKVSGNIRLRYETVSDDAVANDADALTVRTRLGYETAPFKGFTAVAEVEDTHTLFGVDDYAPERAGYATIADPKDTEVNRAYLRYRGISRLDLGYGRQRLNLDNQRFIGGVAWRQDEQTFDGLTALYTGFTDVAINAAYFTQVNGITSAFDSDDIQDAIFNVSYNGFTWGKFTAYAYLLDHEDETDPLVNAGLKFKSNDTLGLRFDGGYLLPITKSVRLVYTAEYASQEFENTAGTVERDADYFLVEGGAVYTMPTAVVTAKLSYEELGSDGGLYGFQTPYGTRHAFNGWVDKFLVTPNSGLEDTFGTLILAFPAKAITATVFYHQYDADVGSADYGSEWNFQLAKVFAPHYTLGIKYGAYSGEDAPYLDTDKFWIWGEFNF